MGRNKRIFIIDLTDPIVKFRKALSYPELPTIDLDVVMSLLFECFEKENIPAEIEKTIINLLSGDLLIENPAWVDNDEEIDIKRYLHQSMHTFAWEMYQQLEEGGLFHDLSAKYAYKRMINDTTLAFTRVP